MANHKQKVLEILEREGWSYREEEENVLFLASYGTRKWKMTIHCTEKGQISCYAAYPWPVPEIRLSKVLAGLNVLNQQQLRGCFFLCSSPSRVLYRCGVQILDEYTSYEAIEDILLTTVAVVNTHWPKVYSLLFGLDEGFPNMQLIKEANQDE